MNIKNPLIEWYTYRSHRLVQRERCPGMVHPTRLVHHVLIESRGVLVRLTIVHRPHRPDHRTEANKLHRRREMDHLGALFVSDDRMECREIRKCRILQFAPANDPLDCKVSVVDSGLERLFPIWETVTRRKVGSFVLPKLFDDPTSATTPSRADVCSVLKRMAHTVE